MKKRLLTFATASALLLGAFGAVQATSIQSAELPPVYSPSSTDVAAELPPVYSKSSVEIAAELPPVYAKKELPPVY
ncbi:hypothetical protein [Rossellomorea aquimaris]|uniref:hypothetical protein n=1 Tax=Rossellomorea aquimaris TaxID=189382 RepID=UPI0005C80A35|nr:hypothetical protein [Rossellomorea aquimaris]